LWSDVWPAIDGVVCLSILLEGRVTVLNNFTKRRQDDFKIGTRDDTFEVGDFSIQFSLYAKNCHHVFLAWEACA